jgi:hypothetical protein
MKVDQWFSSLDREVRKQVLYALHMYRKLAEGNLRPQAAADYAQAHWPTLKGLLEALDDDHLALKALNLPYEGRSLNLCEAVHTVCQGTIE